MCIQILERMGLLVIKGIDMGALELAGWHLVSEQDVELGEGPVFGLWQSGSFVNNIDRSWKVVIHVCEECAVPQDLAARTYLKKHQTRRRKAVDPQTNPVYPRRFQADGFMKYGWSTLAMTCEM